MSPTIQGEDVWFGIPTILTVPTNRRSRSLGGEPLACRGYTSCRQARMVVWNVRSVNDVQKRLEVVSLCKKGRLNVLGMCETKKITEVYIQAYIVVKHCRPAGMYMVEWLFKECEKDHRSW